jgi:AraC family transcriptional regulator
MPAPTARSIADSPPAVLASMSEAPAVALQAGSVRVRHQEAGPFHLSYRGEQPVLLFLFGPARGDAIERTAVCRSGSFAVLTPGASLELHIPDALEVLAVAYDGAGVSSPRGIGAQPRHDLVDPGVRTLAHEMRRVLLRERRPSLDYVEGLARSMLVRALQVIGSTPARRRPAAMTPLKLRRVAEHVAARLDETVSVAALAELSGMSRTHFTRSFQSATGQTPHRFILTQRLEAVLRMLDEGAQDLSVVAARTGFSSHAHMTTAFKQAFGRTPADYRRIREFRLAAAQTPARPLSPAR